MQWLRCVCGSVLFAFALVPANEVSARPKPFSLNWVRDPGAESCITSGGLARAIESMFGPVFVPPSDAELAIEGRIWPVERASGFAAWISVTDRAGVRMGIRELSSAADSCKSLEASIVLVVAMSIDPELGLEQLPPELLDALGDEADPGAALLEELRSAHAIPRVEAPLPAAAAEPTAPVSDAPVLRPETAGSGDEAPLSVQLEAGYAAGIAVLPNLSSGPMVGVALSASPEWSFAARGVLWLPNDAQLAEPNPRGLAVSISMVLASLTTCFSGFRSNTLIWEACGGLATGVRWSDASALRFPSDVTTFDLGPTLASQLRFRIFEPLELRASIAAYLPFQRKIFTYRELGNREQELFEPGPVQGWATIAAAMSL